MTTVTRGIFDPVPLVYVGGQLVASGATGQLGRGLLAVDGLTVNWGRQDVLEQPKPSVGRLTLFDPTATWATSQDRRGVPVQLAYSGTTPDGVTHSSVFFRGRIGSPVQVSRKNVVDPLTGEVVHGALVTLTLQSILLDAANIVPRVAWPVESLGARFDRVVAAFQAAGLLAGGGAIRNYWRGPEVAAVAVKDQRALLDHLGDCFDSAGTDAWEYQPNEDHVHYVQRRNFPTAPSAARLWTDGTDPAKARAGRGAYLRARQPLFMPEAANGLPCYLDAAALEYEPADGLEQPALITRVAVTYPWNGAPTPYDSTTTEVPVTVEPWVGGGPRDESLSGVRTAQTDSLISDQTMAVLSASDTADLVRREGSMWALAPLRLSTARTGGFETLEAAQVLLAGYETNTLFFLQRSWLPQFGQRPIYGFMGGQIGYLAGGWELEVYPSGLTTPTPQHAISWSEIDDGSAAYELQWWDGDNPHGMHETVTYEDLGFIGLGLNITTDPPASSWDAYL